MQKKHVVTPAAPAAIGTYDTIAHGPRIGVAFGF